MTVRRSLPLTALACLLTGCGLKGALELPQRSTNVVIRGPGEPSAQGGENSETATTPSAATPTPETTPNPTQPKPATPPAPRDDRMPPPPLPDGNPGSSRGG